MKLTTSVGSGGTALMDAHCHYRASASRKTQDVVCLRVRGDTYLLVTICEPASKTARMPWGLFQVVTHDVIQLI